MIRYLYYLLAYFLLYSFLGWCLEVAFHAVCVGVIVNRGFMSGPVCPIYGFGMLAILVILYPFVSNTALLVGGGIIFATLIELVGGFLLYKIFHMRWWDYSDEPFNLGGYICLKFSIAWGICIFFAVKVVHPFVEMNVVLFDCLPGYILAGIFSVLFLCDFVDTVLTVAHLNRNLGRMSRITKDLRKVSDELTERIGEGAMEAGSIVQENRVQASLARAELIQEAEEIRERIAKHKYYGYGRLLRAFPELSHSQYNEELQRVYTCIKEKQQKLREAKQKWKDLV